MNSNDTTNLDEAEMFRNELGALINRWIQESSKLLVDDAVEALQDEIFQLKLQEYLTATEEPGEEWKQP